VFNVDISGQKHKNTQKYQLKLHKKTEQTFFHVPTSMSIQWQNNQDNVVNRMILIHWTPLWARESQHKIKKTQ